MHPNRQAFLTEPRRNIERYCNKCHSTPQVQDPIWTWLNRKVLGRSRVDRGDPADRQFWRTVPARQLHSAPVA